MQIRDQTAHSVQSYLDPHCTQKSFCVVVCKERINCIFCVISGPQGPKGDRGPAVSIALIDIRVLPTLIVTVWGPVAPEEIVNCF